jgi:hypothetical protein
MSATGSLVFLAHSSRRELPTYSQMPEIRRPRLRRQSESTCSLLADNQASAVEQLFGIGETALPDRIAGARYGHCLGRADHLPMIVHSMPSVLHKAVGRADTGRDGFR